MEAAHGSTPIHAYDRAKQATRAETERPHALRQAITSCRNGDNRLGHLRQDGMGITSRYEDVGGGACGHAGLDALQAEAGHQPTASVLLRRSHRRTSDDTADTVASAPHRAEHRN
jgi:hypothetical protein